MENFPIFGKKNHPALFNSLFFNCLWFWFEIGICFIKQKSDKDGNAKPI